jgi:hypothetical protein
VNSRREAAARKNEIMKREAIITLQRQRLADWIQTWQMAIRLEALPEPPADAPHPSPLLYPPVRRRANERDAPRIGHPARLLAGAIVLLPPENEATRARPVYVALVEAIRDSRWLVVPFGRFPLPAVPGELATSRKAAPLQVLCVWNAARIDAKRLARGWQVGRLNPREKRWLRQLLDLPPGQKPAAALAPRLGSPLIHPLDPRHDYLEQERMLWFADERATRCDEDMATREAEPEDDVWPRAAEKTDPYRDKR